MSRKLSLSKAQTRQIKFFLILAALLIATGHLGFQLLRNVVDVTDFWIELSNRFNVDDEASVPTWYSSSLLLALSICSFVVSIKKSDKLKKIWQTIAGLFLLMSIDEGASFHETIIWPIRRALDVEQGSILTNAWVLVGAFIVAVLAFGLLKILPYLEPKTKQYFFYGFVLYSLGIIGVETVGGLFVDNEQFYRTWVVLVEEMLEITGLTFFAYAILEELTG